jgi:hypothetical protein
VYNLTATVREAINASIPYVPEFYLSALIILLNVILRRKISTSGDTRNQNPITTIMCLLLFQTG